MKITVSNLEKTYHDAARELRVIAGLNVELPAKGSVAIIGRSGTGKSTLLHLLGGLDKPAAGSIRYGDTDICKLAGDALSDFRGRNVGFIFQFHHLLPEFSALENVSMPLVIAGAPERQAAERAEAMLVKVGLADRIGHRPGQLSGGEQQRVAIARAVVNDPKVILADEPTGNLDFETAKTVQDLLLQINRDLGNVLIVVTHNQDLASSMDIVLEMLPGGKLQ